MGDNIPLDAPHTQGIDQLFDALSKHRRRVILLMLNNGEIENESDLMVRGEHDGRAVQVELVHNHLPKLAEAGYVDWDRETGAISKGPRFDEIEPLLELMETHADELPHGWP